MIVADLIHELKKLDPDAMVVIPSGDRGDYWTNIEVAGISSQIDDVFVIRAPNGAKHIGMGLLEDGWRPK